MPKPYRLLLASAAIAVLPLTGCSNLNQTVPKTDVPAASTAKATPSPTPTPTTWTLEEASAAYLQAVCGPNRLVIPYNTALQNGDLEGLHTLAPQAVAADQEAAKKLDQGRWPADITADVAAIRDAYFARIPAEQETANAPSMDALNAIAWPDQTAASTASQRLRARLNLSTEQLQGC